jgi:hypothetical protein
MRLRELFSKLIARRTPEKTPPHNFVAGSGSELSGLVKALDEMYEAYHPQPPPYYVNGQLGYGL